MNNVARACASPASAGAGYEKESDQLVGFDMAESVTDGTNGIPVCTVDSNRAAGTTYFAIHMLFRITSHYK